MNEQGPPMKAKNGKTATTKKSTACVEQPEKQTVPEEIIKLCKGAQGLRTIAKKKYEPPQWTVVGALSRPGLAILGGGAKRGKTWLGVQLGSNVSRGEPFLGNPDFPTEQCEVLFLSLQLRERQFQQRMREARITPDNRMKVLFDFPRGEEAMMALRNYKETALQ